MTQFDPHSHDAHPHDAAAEHAHAMAMLDDDHYAQFVLQHRNEILPVLRGLIGAVSQVTMFFNEGRDMVITSLIECRDDQLLLDVGPTQAMNDKALQATKLFCVTQLDKVRIQFMLSGVTLGEVDGRPAFVARMPDAVMRLQRREFYRLSLPLTRPLECGLEFVDEAGAPRRVVGHVGDISGGGLGVIGLPLDVMVSPGLMVRLVRLELPETGLISGQLRVCSTAEVTNRVGAKSLRAGCEFVKLPGQMQTLVQRYIIKVERDRKARDAGLG